MEWLLIAQVMNICKQLQNPFFESCGRDNLSVSETKIEPSACSPVSNDSHIASPEAVSPPSATPPLRVYRDYHGDYSRDTAHTPPPVHAHHSTR